MQATGAQAYNVLQNNGSSAHQAVRHVHFHIIAKFAEAGLGITWHARSLDQANADRLVKKMRAALGADGS